MIADLLNIFNIIVYGLGLLMLLLIYYVILFKTYYNYEPEDRPKWLKPMGWLFLLSDFILDVIVMTPLMALDLPKWRDKEFTITARMKRYKEITNTDTKLRWWRFHFSDNMCLILNVFDKKKGGHC